MLNTVFGNPWVRAGALLGALVLLGLLCYLLTPVLVPLLFAFLVAYMLNPVINALHRYRISRGTAVAGLAVLAIVIAIALPLILVPQLITEADRLISGPKQSGEPATGILASANQLIDKLPLERLVELLGWTPAGQEHFDARAVLAQKIGSYVKANAGAMLKAYAPTMAGYGGRAGAGIAQLFRSLGRGIVSFVVFLGSFALFAFVAGYLLRDFEVIVAYARRLVPLKYRAKTFDIVSRIDGQLRSFLRGQITVCLCLGIMYTIGLVISGVPFAVPIAAFGAVASFVPYLGLMLTIGPALLLALLQHGVDWHIIGVVATFIIAQSVEGTVLTPRIVGKQVGLNPVWVILAVMVFGSTLGFVGLLLAVPIAACLKVLVQEGLEYYKRSPFFETDAS